MKKILIMADARSIHTDRWCRFLEIAGYDTALFSLEDKTIEYPKKSYSGSRPTGRGIIDYYLAKKHFLSVVADFKPDIINAHYVNSYGWLASHCDKCPIVITAWGSDLLITPKKSFVHKRRVAKALKHAAYCTVDAQVLHDVAVKYISSDKIIRIIMGVDEGFYNSLKKSDFSNNKSTRIFAPRGLQPVYDPETIIKAAKILASQYSFCIDMLGTAPETDRYNKLIKELGISQYISIKPKMMRDKYEAGLPGYDIYLSASLSDSTSVALLEAMSVGLYPVVSDIPGNREWIENGRNGLLFDSGNANALAKTMAGLFDGKIDTKQAAAFNRERIKEKAIWQDNMNRFCRLIDELTV